MNQIVSISLENEMDLILAHRKTMRLAEQIGLTIATQTSFATAVSEVARIIIEHTNTGVLDISITGNVPRYNLKASVSFNNSTNLTASHSGFVYAKRLVPEFEFQNNANISQIELSIGLPRSLKIDKLKILNLQHVFSNEAPINAYEEIKNKNSFLSKITVDQEEEIKQEKLINEKKNEFISTASHELKTPITILKAYTQILKKRPEECSEYVNSIIDKLDLQTTKLTSLIQQLMDVSQIENGSIIYNLEEFSLNPFLTEIIDMLKYVHSQHSLILKLDEDCIIKADKLRLEQVFTNLLGNAAKYSAKNTSITVNTKKLDQEVMIEVSDSGIGMNKAEIKSIFNKFYRNKDVLESHQGLGMGLFITSKIVMDHHGTIGVDSDLGKGSTFYVKLPIVQD